MTETGHWTRSTLPLLEAMPDAVVVVDAAGRVVYANRLIEQVFGYSPDALVGRSVEILVPEEARQRHRRQRKDYGLAPAVRPMGAVSHVLGLHKSGREFPADISLSPIESDEGFLVIAAVRNMTDRHRIEAALRDANEELGRANERLGRDLTVAAKIQKSLLPGRPAGIPGVEVDWIYEPCEKLGGDSFNAFEITAGLIGFYLLDVAGHGTVAALHSVALTRVLASTWTASERSSPSQLLKWLNAEFPIDSEFGQYFTFLCGMLDQATGTLRYACAGHPGPIHVPRGGAPTALGGAGLPVGFFPDADYDECKVTLRPGDRLYLYSDGLTEAMNGEHEDFGIAGLVESLTRTQGAPLGDTVQDIRRAVSRWRDGEKLDDDLTLLALEVVTP
ncbi:MAG: SpoIIE family protein phosphatase [Gammaproteobacteria bacterium]|nr:SpoIIE family protein phosphatase [Gammaproteobacteria bacterium]